MDRLASPPWYEWGEPGGAAVAWVVTHLTATTVFLTVIACSQWSQPWRQSIAFDWAILNSGLVLRLAIGLFRGSRFFRGQDLWERPHWVARPGHKAAGYIAATQTALILVSPLGAPAVGAFGATAALTFGARAAGLDAWEKVHRPAGYYVRQIASWRGLRNAVFCVVCTGVTFWLLAVLVDPFGDPQPVEELLGIDLSRGRQFVVLVVSVAAFTPPALAVCEAISAIARFQRDLEARLAAAERSRQREHIARILHDSALTITQEIFRTSTDPDHRRLVAALEDSLRSLRAAHDAHRGPRPVRECLRDALHLANHFGIDLQLEATVADLNAPLPPDAAAALAHLALVLVGNSGNARATSAALRTEAVPRAIDVSYHDDGGGFDPDEAIRRRGGLHDVAEMVSELGGTIGFARQGGRTVTHVRIPA